MGTDATSVRVETAGHISDRNGCCCERKRLGM